MTRIGTIDYEHLLLYRGELFDPHGFLGPHVFDPSHTVIRMWRPGADKLFFEFHGKIVEAIKIDKEGIFEFITDSGVTWADYRIFHTDGRLAHDPYAFEPSLGQIDEYLFARGVHYQLFDVLGGRLTNHQGCDGVKFSVWAPTAKGVAIVGDFNYWDGRANPMRSMGASGIWEIFIPGIGEGCKYKFEIRTQSNHILVKADPYALSAEMRPLTASIIADVDHFAWEDHDWLEKRASTKDKPKPMNVYELHLGSWKKRDGYFLNYREIADELVKYCHQMGYTHVQLLPVAEHPLDESWGYQVTGFYAVTSRYGKPQDFQAFVNTLHKHEIGVLVDWVPAHFPTDDFSLARFDGSNLYEHADWRQGFHPHWNTYIFNYGRHEVANFLLANALFWFQKMHIDGLRVDAVASMLYLDYGREEGEWIPNRYGGKENLEAIEFIKHLNSIVHEKFPGILMVAEESTSFTGVTHPLQGNGLGFDLKWNMGWMNDTLRFFHVDPLYRNYHQNLLTFGLIYAFSEKFALVLSHDEVVHGKGSLLSKMPGDYWQKFANLRLLYSYMICQPGKKLLFMGGEIGQWNEWNCKSEVEWFLLKYPAHDSIQKMIQELNHFYLAHGALWERDFDYSGFEWVDFSDTRNNVISYLRKGSQGTFLCIHNFTPAYYPSYFVRLRLIQQAKEVFNTDAEHFGGSGKINGKLDVIRGYNGLTEGIEISLAPLATQIYEVQW